MKMGWALLLVAGSLLAAGVRPLHAQVLISELVADNNGDLLDEDGDTYDWIELFNSGSKSVAMLDWSLTDDPADPGRWRFPDVTLPPGEFLVVFASGLNRTDPEGQLHTNFRLSRPGEFLALLGPGGAPASVYAPEFPRQQAGASYGLPMQALTRELLATGAPARYLVTTNSLGRDLPEDWNQKDFDDSEWLEGTSGFGFDRKAVPTHDEFIETDVGEAMFGNRASFFLRFSFDVDDRAILPGLQMRAQYDSGFVAFLNGVEVARRNTNNSVSPSSSAASPRSGALATTFEKIILSGAQALLEPGRNVLAVQAINDGRRNSDFLFRPVVETVVVTDVEVDSPGYFETPTPGSANAAAGRSALAPPPVFATAGTFFSQPISVELSVAGTAEVRYTLDGSDPDEQSTLYDGPIQIVDTTTVRARSVSPDAIPSLIVQESYVALGEDLADFTSDLPLFFISTPRGIGTTNIPMVMQVVDVDTSGRSSTTGEPHFLDSGAIRIRGSSSEGRPKKAYTFEIQDEDGDDKQVEILGFPADSDYILYAPYNFDRALMRNAFIYEVSNQVGRYAVRTKFCEVFVKSSPGPITMDDYVGVYSFMEKIKRGPERVDVEAIALSEDTEPGISGGYIIKIDRPDPGDTGLSAGGQIVRHVYPKEENIAPAQADWLKQYFDDFNRALRGPDAGDPDLGYAAYIDVGAWIDHHLLNEFTKNPDGYVLSAYMFKPRGEKLAAGPIWDFDRTMGPDDDDRARSPAGWSNQRVSTWWGALLADPGFLERYHARWREMRRDVMTAENLHAVIDGMADEIREAQARNFERWNLFLSDGWQGEVDHLKNWVASRLEWMDSELSNGPTIVESGGPVDPGFQVTILPGDGTTYYTLTGADPRGEDGRPSPDAFVYDGEVITINQSTRVRARGQVDLFWTGEAQADFIVGPPPLVITEIMYNPPAAADFSTNRFEFLEIQNITDSTLDVTGLNLAPRPIFAFADGAVSTLGPGERMVVVQSLEHFSSRYPVEDINVAGEYSRPLANGGQTVGIEGLIGTTPISLSLRYDDAWYPVTNGAGFSLVLNDPNSDPSTWSDAGAWRPSANIHGSPDREEPSAGLQKPGDLTQDGGVNLADVMALLSSLRSETALPCETLEANTELRDVNGDASANIGDAFHLLVYLFRAGPPPVPGTSCVLIVRCPDACGS